MSVDGNMADLMRDRGWRSLRGMADLLGMSAVTVSALGDAGLLEVVTVNVGGEEELAWHGGAAGAKGPRRMYRVPGWPAVKPTQEVGRSLEAAAHSARLLGLVARAR